MPRLDLRADYAEDIVRRLHAPDPTYGWTGDDSLLLAWNSLERRYEVWSRRSDGDHLVCRCPTGERIDVPQLLRGLAERDTHVRNNDAIRQMERIIDANEKVHRDKEQAAVEALAEKQDKLYWAAARDIGYQYGYVRPISVPEFNRRPQTADSAPK